MNSPLKACVLATLLAMPMLKAVSQETAATSTESRSTGKTPPDSPHVVKTIDLSSTKIREAFQNSHEGYSSDELLIQDELRNAFLKELQIDPELSSDRQMIALRKLLQLRKSGRLDVPTTKRSQVPTNAIQAAIPTAEIAIRTVLDRHDAMIDDVLCNPVWRNELQREAERLSSDISAETVRRAVLRLRKSRRLKPELVLRVADWDRTVSTYPMQELDLDSLPNTPGVYLFRDLTGYLYIGEAVRLRDRIGEHLRGSHNDGLAGVLSGKGSNPVTLELHAFPADSPAKRLTVRRAYESELIRSRQPRFNLQP
ncbi:GIY-YIG nuclease family protein [Rhodopirellula sp. JC740]|uniref:GIY-YIG nuclease family protein n=1 Tax=Rhodopirellula halodulae TaxID=2894198 RepID=A0ABS8NCW6_9BACT|nr:GIY-YIG nuclease family protein [Rhodopirellula sp. JC740]MCC9641244.1 GIY-YIG nuclease family protein [Rhodopirellula sp. JC740]